MKDFFSGALTAVTFLTRIPVPAPAKPPEEVADKALCLFPLVGWLLGAALLCLWLLLDLSGLSGTFATAAVIIAADTALTGGFHLDGLADCFDAFFSIGKSREEKLAIMKDSRIGAMGATALCLTLIARVSLVSELLGNGAYAALVFFPVVGRWSQVALYSESPYVRQGGTGSLFAKHADRKTLMCASLFLLPLVFRLYSVAAFLLAVLFLICYRHHAQRQIGGITGDVLGSATVLSETVFLLGTALFFW